MSRLPITHPEAWPHFTLTGETGELELAVGEAAGASVSRPEKVTAILTAMLAEIDGRAVDAESVRSLSTGTREWMLQQLSATCRPERDRFEVTCRHCGELYDITFDLAALPREGPGAEFPAVTVTTSVGTLTFEIPNGFHEEALARAKLSGDSALRFLFAEAALFEAAEELIGDLDAEVLHEIDAAMDAIAPETADQAQSSCVACGAEQETRIDPLVFAFPPEMRVLREVHRLSSAYQWSEASILSMPSRRRRHYVDLVSENAGVWR